MSARPGHEAAATDLAGRPVDASASFPGGGGGAGLDGLRKYIGAHRHRDFVDNISRKLLSYALSRTLQLSDDPVVEAMTTRMSATGYRFGSLVETIVTSPQFLNRRAPESPRLHPAH